MKSLGTIIFSEEQRAKFSSGQLAAEWFQRYPQLFDQDDCRLVAKGKNYHFFEWLGAIIIYETIGYLSLVEKYQFKNHKRKTEVLLKVFSGKFPNSIFEKGVQCPDLFCYSLDYQDYFFCEIKGLTDRVRNEQKSYFDRLQTLTGKEIYLLKFEGMTNF